MLPCIECSHGYGKCRGCPKLEGLNALEEVHETDVSWHGKTLLQLSGTRCFVCDTRLEQWTWVMGGQQTIRTVAGVSGPFVPRCLDNCTKREPGSNG